SKVIDAVDMDITYYAEGKINDEERYKNSPFEVRGKLKSDTYLDVPIKLEIVNGSTFKLRYNEGEEDVIKTYRFGDRIQNDLFDFRIFLTEFYDPLVSNAQYYFIINSEKAQLD